MTTDRDQQEGGTMPEPQSSAAYTPPTSAEIQALTRGRVERLEGEHDAYPNRRWVTWRTYFDGELLGNAVDEAEGWRWITDMIKLEARNGA